MRDLARPRSRRPSIGGRAICALAVFVCIASAVPVQAQRPGLEVVQDGRTSGVHARVGEVVRLRVQPRRGTLDAAAQVVWHRIVPRPVHVDLPYANDGDPTYANSVLGGEDHGEWLGFDTLEYDVVPVVANDHLTIEGQSLVVRGTGAHGGAGTQFFGATATLPDGRVLSTATIDHTDSVGLAASVFRVSFRQSDDFLGWMSSYFDVPYVFGSTPRQSERYTGIDCADVLVAARRRDSGANLRYTSVSGIGRLAEAASEVVILRRDDRILRDGEGAPVELRWGSDVLPGDLMAIDYADDPDGELPRAWDHIGALLRDSGPGGRPDGVLGGDDLLRHMGRRGLVDEPLHRHGSVRLRVWRWKR